MSVCGCRRVALERPAGVCFLAVSLPMLLQGWTARSQDRDGARHSREHQDAPGTSHTSAPAPENGMARPAVPRIRLSTAAGSAGASPPNSVEARADAPGIAAQPDGQPAVSVDNTKRPSALAHAFSQRSGVHRGLHESCVPPRGVIGIMLHVLERRGYNGDRAAARALCAVTSSIYDARLFAMCACLWVPDPDAHWAA